jgi:hypothetical protein
VFAQATAPVFSISAERDMRSVSTAPRKSVASRRKVGTVTAGVDGIAELLFAFENPSPGDDLSVAREELGSKAGTVLLLPDRGYPHFLRYRSNPDVYARATDALAGGRPLMRQLDLIAGLGQEVISSPFRLPRGKVVFGRDLGSRAAASFHYHRFLWVTEQFSGPASGVIWMLKLQQSIPALKSRTDPDWGVLLPRRLQLRPIAEHRLADITVKMAMLGS